MDRRLEDFANHLSGFTTCLVFLASQATLAASAVLDKFFRHDQSDIF